MDLKTEGGETWDTVKVNFAIEIRVVKNLHGDFLLAVELGFEIVVVDGDILLDVLAGKNDFFVFPPPIDTHKSPIRDRDWDPKQEDEENIRLEPPAIYQRQNALDEPWNDEDECRELEVGEITRTLGKTDEGGIFDSRGVGDMDVGRGHGQRIGDLFWV
jgi:hypothetical protein